MPISAMSATAKPFVKWAGGKGQLIKQLSDLLPNDFEERKEVVYVEPFVGGGAMLFYMLSTYPNIKKAIINDLNLDLVAYQPKGSSPGPGSWLMGWVWSK
jgi:DNA adenine methylase